MILGILTILSLTFSLLMYLSLRKLDKLEGSGRVSDIISYEVRRDIYMALAIIFGLAAIFLTLLN